MSGGAVDPPVPPSPWRTAAEVLAAREPWRLAWRGPTLARLPRGDGGVVLLVPGLGATDASLLPLRSMLSHLGHDARSAGLGRMTDQVRDHVERMVDRTDRAARSSGRAVALVGWSIGGVVSREVARIRPDRVRRVITFGTPVHGGPAATALARRYSPEQLAAIRELVARRTETPLRVPVTAIYSPNDGIVSAAACIDHHTPDVEHVEVSSTHLGLGLDPDVWEVVARRLARP